MLIRLLIVILIFLGSVIPSHAWLIYHKSAFKGKVIDAETKEAIEGVVVVAVYYEGIFGFAEGINRFLDIQETITNQNGEFYIPSYTTITPNPFSITGDVEINIIKNQYGSISGTWNGLLKTEWGAPKGTYIFRIEDAKPIIMLKKTISIKESEKYLYHSNLPLEKISCEKMKSLRLYEEHKKELLEFGIKRFPCKEGFIQE